GATGAVAGAALTSPWLPPPGALVTDAHLAAQAADLALDHLVLLVEARPAPGGAGVEGGLVVGRLAGRERLALEHAGVVGRRDDPRRRRGVQLGRQTFGVAGHLELVGLLEVDEPAAHQHRLAPGHDEVAEARLAGPDVAQRHLLLRLRVHALL